MNAVQQRPAVLEYEMGDMNPRSLEWAESLLPADAGMTVLAEIIAAPKNEAERYDAHLLRGRAFLERGKGEDLVAAWRDFDLSGKTEKARVIEKASALDCDAELYVFEQILALTEDLEEKVDMGMKCGNALLRKKDYIGARRSFENVLDLLEQGGISQAPWKRAEALKSLALVCDYQELPMEAEAFFEKGRKASESHMGVLRSYADFYKHRGQLAQAIDVCTEGLKHHRPDFLYLRARIQFLRFEKLLACFVSREEASPVPWKKIQQMNRRELSSEKRDQLVRMEACFDKECRLHARQIPQRWIFPFWDFWEKRVALLRKDLQGTRDDCSAYLTIRGILKPYAIDMAELASKAAEMQGDLSTAVRYLKQADSFDDFFQGIERSRKILQMELEAKKKAMSPDKALQLAQTLLEKDPEKALELFQQVLEDGGVETDALLGRAKIFVARGDFDSAIDDLDQLKEVSPSQKIAIYQLYVRMRLQEGLEFDENLESAWKLCKQRKEIVGFLAFLREMGLFEKALEFCAKTKGTLLEQAKIYAEWKKWAELKEVCEKWIDEHLWDTRFKAQRIEVYDFAAMACLELGFYAEAYGNLESAYQLDTSPATVDRFEKMEELHQRLQGGYTAVAPPLQRKESWTLEEAIKSCVEEDPEGALKLLQHNISCDVILRARIYVGLGDFARARVDLERIVRERYPLTIIDRINPSYSVKRLKLREAQARYWLAEIYLKEEKIEEALPQLREAWELFKEFEEKRLGKEEKKVWFQIPSRYIIALADRGDFKTAHEVCRKAYSCDLFNANDHYLHRAHIYLDEGEWDRALEDCKMVDDIQSHELAIKICVAARNYSQAKRYAKRAYDAETDPSRFIERFETWKEMETMQVTADHFAEHFSRFYKSKESVKKKIAYLSRFLEAYAAELKKLPQYFTEALWGRSGGYRDLEQYDLAITDLEKALTVAPKDLVKDVQRRLENTKGLKHIQER